jgi:CRP-like cAMP-binding protein
MRADDCTHGPALSTGKHPGGPATVYRQADPATDAILIGSGRAKVTLSAAHGKQVLLAVRGPGEFLGEFAVVDRTIRSATVRALTALTGWCVPGDLLLAHLATEPGAALELLRLVVGRLRESDRQRLDFGALDTTGRVARLLLGLADRHQQAGWLHLNQTELGEAVGASREATVKALSRLRRVGLIETARGRIRVLRPAGLAAVARSEPVSSYVGLHDDPGC